MKAFFKALFFDARLYIAFWVLVCMFLLSHLIPVLFPLSQILLGLIVILTALDMLLIFSKANGVSAQRILPDRFSNGDENPVSIPLSHSYPFGLVVQVLDEIPIQFQRKQTFRLSLPPKSAETLTYSLRPTERGNYEFGVINVIASGPLQLVKKRYQLGEPTQVPTYPSFLQMRSYQLMAISNRLTEIGIKKIRRLGHTTEFETIKEYVRGDDYRTINWKATARSSKLMVNQYIDERAQHVYFLIDKSRSMKMPFEGLSLLDYAINATLVLSNIVIYKHDFSGLLTFSERIGSFVKAGKKATQMNLIMEVLYQEQTRYLEADYAKVYGHLKRHVAQRSLIMLFTNFESPAAMRRQLTYLQGIARQHLLVVIFFENTELEQVLQSQPENMEDMYVKGITEHTRLQKKLIARELQQYGIHTIFTPPQNLTVNALNKYLELKARGLA